MTRGLSQLRGDELALHGEPLEFSKLTAAILGEHITPADGWDDAVAEVLGNLGQEPDTLNSLASDLAEPAFTAGQFEDQNIAPLLASHGEFVTAGDSLLSDLADAITISQSPAPPAGDGGGGQGGGDGGGGGGRGGPGGPPAPPARERPPLPIPSILDLLQNVE